MRSGLISFHGLSFHWPKSNFILLNAESGQRHTNTPALTLTFDRRIGLSQSHGDAEVHENEIDQSSVALCETEVTNSIRWKSGEDSRVPFSFGGGDWRKITTKDTKSTKREFDDFFNRVIGYAIKFHRCNNTRAEGWHLAFLSSDSFALFVPFVVEINQWDQDS